MILPILGYGHPVLRQETEEITQEYAVKELLRDMYETMYNASGVGLAAPQVGVPIRLFIVDGFPFSDMEGLTDSESAALKNFKRVFINPIIIEEIGKEWAFEEGCLSIPGVNADVMRKENIVIEYYTENWELVEESFSGFIARIIQHEYDHIEGVLFPDLVSPLKKKFLSKKLNKIMTGEVSARYEMVFGKRKK